MSTSTTHPHRRLRWWKVLLLALAGLLVLFLIYAGLAVASLVGAFDSLRGDPPREGDPEVVAARQESAAALQQEAALVTQSAVLPGLPPGSALLAQGEVVPPCHEGQHNWKINDDFDLACSQARREVVTVPTGRRSAPTWCGSTRSLRAQGWRPSFQPIPDVLTGYWDPLAGEAVAGRLRRRASTPWRTCRVPATPGARCRAGRGRWLCPGSSVTRATRT